MTPKQADVAIRTKRPISVRDCYGDTFELVIVARDRRCIETADGGRYERGNLEIVYPHA